jgi:hypothetical protein
MGESVSSLPLFVSYKVARVDDLLGLVAFSRPGHRDHGNRPGKSNHQAIIIH